MRRELIKTGDSSWTIQLPAWNEQYHSKYGAITEALHVFIKNGLDYYCCSNSISNTLAVLEIGFGTGLNTLLSLQYTKQNNVIINYTGLEAYPISAIEWKALNYAPAVCMPAEDFELLHMADWEKPVTPYTNFTLLKKQQTFDTLSNQQTYHLVYYDAFGPRVQPKLWQYDMLKKTYDALKPGGVWVSYCAKGDVRRCLQKLGFEVERLPGPPGKRHMLRATKPS